MKKERSFGVNRVTSDKFYMFNDQSSALRHCLKAQNYYATLGYLTTSSLNTENKRIEVTVHFEGKPFPSAPASMLYTFKETTSHQYWSDYEGKQVRVRCVTYYFKY